MPDAGEFSIECEQRLLRELGPSVYGGTSVGESLAAERVIQRLGPASRAAVLAECAQRQRGDAESRARRGRTVSAREQFLKASHTYRLAARALAHGSRRYRELSMHSRQAFTAAMTLSGWQFEALELSAGEDILDGYHLAPSPEPRRRRILLVSAGEECSLEETFLRVGRAGLERGWQLLLVGGADSRVEGHDGAWLSCWLDIALERADVQPRQLAVLGIGSGSYHALSVAAADARPAAVVADPPVLEPAWAGAQAVEPTNIRCPVLALIGSAECPDAFEQYERLMQHVSGPAHGHVFTPDEGAEYYEQLGNLGYANAVLYDWLEEIVAG